MQDYRKLKVWEKAHQLVLMVYRATRGYPSDERFGLTSQTRRAAYSVPMNLAEGTGRSSDADFLRFVWIANGSAKELDYQLLLARDLGCLPPDVYDDLARSVTEIQRMLAGLIDSLRADR